MRPAWVEVKVSAIRENVAAVNSFIGARTDVLAIVKADAYGHGLISTAHAALEGGAVMLGLAIPEEVACLRAAGITAPTLIIGCSSRDQADLIMSLDTSAVVSYPEAAQALADAALARGLRARLHVKVNTGMGRVGVRWNEAVDFIRRVAAMPGVELEGIMTHFATADEEDQTAARTQLSRFLEVVDHAAAHGIRPRFCHCANSAAISFLPESHCNLVRPGLLVYGIAPAPDNRALPFPLRPALSLKARVVQINHLPAGDAVGYGLTYRAERDSVFAALPLGYADGVSRALSNRGQVIIHGRRAPLAGRVSMDQILIDVTDIPDVVVGDTAVLIGQQDDEYISAWDVALARDSIAYEVTSNLSARLPRVYDV